MTQPITPLISKINSTLPAPTIADAVLINTDLNYPYPYSTGSHNVAIGRQSDYIFSGTSANKEAIINVTGQLIINGENIQDRLNRIETRLNIPTRDVAMEDKHPKLKKLFAEYMHELEKYKTWDRIKGKDE